ncbi:MAG: peptidylprolyl isomerase, partial [Lysobacterales bacterium]
MRYFRHPAIWLGCLVLASLGFTGHVKAEETKPIDSIVALVDDDVILRSELDTAIKGVVDRIHQQGGELPPRHLLEKQVLERLIMRQLQLQRARQTGIHVSDADIDQALIKLAKQNKLTLSQLRTVIESEGEDFAEFRKNIGEELMADRLKQRVVNSMAPVTETEIDIALASDKFNGGEYNISHILIALPQGATPDQIAVQESKAENVYQQLQDGLDFASAAISYSDSEEALDGGLVGWRDLNSIPTSFADAVKKLKVGQFTRPIRSPVGFHIIKVNDYRDHSQVMATEYHARHIMIKTSELVNARDAMQRIRDIRKQLDEGASFEELAKKNSDDVTSANLGGDMGWFSAQAYGDRMQQTLAGLKDGEISEPFQTEDGWHIVQRLGKREKDVTDQAI